MFQIFGKIDIPGSKAESVKNTEVMDMNMVTDKIVEAVKKNTTG